MSFGTSSGHKKTRLLFITCISTFILCYLHAQPRHDKKTNSSPSVTLTPQTPNTDLSASNSLNSPNLQPPSQEWAHAQFYKAMSFLGWEYHGPLNNWEKCSLRTYFFPKINTIFTGIPKTGCSNWLIALLGAEGELKRTVNPSKLNWVHGGITDNLRIKNIFGEYDRSVFQNAFSFTVVRNPWTRMVSAYRQKLSDEDTQGGAYRWMGQKIVREIRNITDPNLLEVLYPTFEEYVRYLIKYSPRHVDRHFTLQTRELCIPHAMYDFIVPLEYSATLSQEVWSKINGSDTSLLGSYDKASDPRLQSSALYAKKWLSELGPELIEQVYEIYKADFILMNYSNFTHPDFPLPLQRNI